MVHEEQAVMTAGSPGSEELPSQRRKLPWRRNISTLTLSCRAALLGVLVPAGGSKTASQ